MPDHVSRSGKRQGGARGAATVTGELVSYVDGLARGWVSPVADVPLVVLRLNRTAAGAGSALMASGSNKAGASVSTLARREFAVELDPGRAVQGGVLTAECLIGSKRVRLDGEIKIESASALADGLTPHKPFAFRKAGGLTIEGWVARPDRGAAPVLSVIVDGATASRVAPSTLASEAWRSGGRLASGYSISVALPDASTASAEVSIVDDTSGLELWRGVLDERDCLVEDIRQIVSCGRDRYGASDKATIRQRIAAFADLLAADPKLLSDKVVGPLTLDLCSWLMDHEKPAIAFETFLNLKPSALMAGRSTFYLDTLAAITCCLPKAAVVQATPRLSAWVAEHGPSRVLSFLDTLGRIRNDGLAGGIDGVIAALQSMNFSQTALNWVWEAVAASPADARSVRGLRQAVELEIIARNVPFSGGFEVAADKAT